MGWVETARGCSSLEKLTWTFMCIMVNFSGWPLKGGFTVQLQAVNNIRINWKLHVVLMAIIPKKFLPWHSSKGSHWRQANIHHPRLQVYEEHRTFHPLWLNCHSQHSAAASASSLSHLPSSHVCPVARDHHYLLNGPFLGSCPQDHTSSHQPPIGREATYHTRCILWPEMLQFAHIPTELCGQSFSQSTTTSFPSAEKHFTMQKAFYGQECIFTAHSAINTQHVEQLCTLQPEHFSSLPHLLPPSFPSAGKLLFCHQNSTKPLAFTDSRTDGLSATDNRSWLNTETMFHGCTQISSIHSSLAGCGMAGWLLVEQSAKYVQVLWLK